MQAHSVSTAASGHEVNDVGAIAPVHDRGDRIIQLQRDLADSRTQVEAFQRQQAALAHGISHDMRAPLRAIASYAGLLDSHCAGQLDPTGHQYLARIRDAAGRMGELLDGLLELSRIERCVVHPEAVDASLLAEWAAAELSDLHPDQEGQVSVQPGLRAWADERLLKTALTQLLANAWTFSAHAPPIRIQVTGESADGWLHLQVRDGGRGFESQYAQRIFEPFQRLHAADAGSGAGLGLAIAARIAERLDGRIGAYSDGPGQGSCFTLELPLPPPVQDEH